MRYVGIPVLLLGALAASSAHAVPTTMTYAGVLKDNGALVSSTVDVVFRIFTAETGGTEVYTESQTGVVVVGGDLVAELGNNALDDSVLDRPQLWLEVTVDGDVLDPRVRLNALPYALRAEKAAVADALGTLAPNDVVTQTQLVTLHLDQGLSAGSGITITNGQVSIASGAIIASMLAANAVGTATIQDNAVTGAKIQDGTLTNADISSSAAIAGSKLATDSITATQIGAGAVASSEIADLSITSTDLAPGAVTSTRIGTGAVTSTALANSKHLFQVTQAGCVEAIGLLTTTGTCARDTSGCTSGQCRDCASNVCGSANCGLNFCFNTEIGFVVGP